MNMIWKVLGFAVLLVVVAFAGIIGKFVGKSTTERFIEGKQSAEIDTVLLKTAEEINKKLPMMVDQDTRLDTTIGYGKKFRYNYTMVTFAAEDIDPNLLENEFVPLVRNRACSTEQMKMFFKNGVTVDYSYSDKTGKHFKTISVTPGHCGY